MSKKIKKVIIDVWVVLLGGDDPLSSQKCPIAKRIKEAYPGLFYNVDVKFHNGAGWLLLGFNEDNMTRHYRLNKQATAWIQQMHYGPKPEMGEGFRLIVTEADEEEWAKYMRPSAQPGYQKAQQVKAQMAPQPKAQLVKQVQVLKGVPSKSKAKATKPASSKPKPKQFQRNVPPPKNKAA